MNLYPSPADVSPGSVPGTEHAAFASHMPGQLRKPKQKGSVQTQRGAFTLSLPAPPKVFEKDEWQ